MPDSKSPTVKTEAEILRDQRASIVNERRKAAGFAEVGLNSSTNDDSPSPALAHKDDASTSQTCVSVDDQCVGLALSGGGVRSAAFCLGVIQAFHKFGLLRFVDFVSAVSGGTYAAAMLSESLKPNRRYTRENRSEFSLAPESTGQQPERVLDVSRRTNYLYRADLFLSRFIPNFLLNLAPRVALIVAVGAGVAFLWRCLDFHAVRDHFAALGFGNDYVPALAPAIVLCALWALTYLVGLLAYSTVFLRVATRLMWLTLAALAIGVAVLVGNGDVGVGSEALSGNDGTRLFWLNDIWTPFAILVGVGCVPLFWPQQLLKSGVAPESWTDSWIFYYASLALFLGVPLVSIGWFAKENISGFNDYRGPEILIGDIRDQRGFAQLATGELNNHAVYFEDLDLLVTVSVPRKAFRLPDEFLFSDLAKTYLGPLAAADLTVEHERKAYLALLDDQLAAQDALQTEKEFPTDNQRNAMRRRTRTTRRSAIG